MTAFAIAKATHDALDSQVRQCGAVLRAFPTGPMGLTPNSVKFSSEFRQAKRAFDTAFARLRAYNATFATTYAKELREDRKRRKGF